MRKILLIGLFLCAASAVAPLSAHAGGGGVASDESPVVRFDQFGGAAAMGRDYGLFVMVLWFPVAVVGWGVQREARRRARRAR